MDDVMTKGSVNYLSAVLWTSTHLTSLSARNINIRGCESLATVQRMAPPLSPAKKQLICDMTKNGKSISDTAFAAECSKQAV